MISFLNLHNIGENIQYNAFFDKAIIRWTVTVTDGWLPGFSGSCAAERITEAAMSLLQHLALDKKIPYTNLTITAYSYIKRFVY